MSFLKKKYRKTSLNPPAPPRGSITEDDRDRAAGLPEGILSCGIGRIDRLSWHHMGTSSESFMLYLKDTKGYTHFRINWRELRRQVWSTHQILLPKEMPTPTPTRIEDMNWIFGVHAKNQDLDAYQVGQDAATVWLNIVLNDFPVDANNQRDWVLGFLDQIGDSCGEKTITGVILERLQKLGYKWS